MFWTPAFAGVTIQGIFYEIIKFDSLFRDIDFGFPDSFRFILLHIPFSIPNFMGRP